MADNFMNFGSPFVPQGPDIEAPEPTTDEEKQARLSGWAKLQATMQNPDIQMGILRAGLTMMQPVPVGQTPLGHAAAAFGQSVDYVGAIREQRRQQDLQNQQAASINELRSAQTGQSRAETAAIPARTAQVQAQTARLEALTPVEVSEARKKLALLDFQIKDAPLESDRKKLQRDRDALLLELDTKFGGQLKQMELDKGSAYNDYHRAMSAGQRALVDKYKTDADKGKGWQLRNVSKDDETGVVMQTFVHPDGRTNTVMIRPGQTYADAKAQASREVKAMSKETLAARYPGMKPEQVIEEMAKELQQTKTDIRTMTMDPQTGVPTIHDPRNPPTTPSTMFDSEESAKQAAIEGARTGQLVKATWPQSAQAPRVQTLPPGMEDKPDGTIVPAKPGSPSAAISDNWVKRGGKLVPATAEDMTRAKPPEKKDVPADRPTVGNVRNVPSGVSQETAERYSKVVRGGGRRFDHVSYEEDLAEFESLIDKRDAGTAPAAAAGRLAVLGHKLGIPVPAVPGPQPKGKKSVSLKVKRGADGKIDSLEIQNSEE